jgi:hypothetical protein
MRTKTSKIFTDLHRFATTTYCNSTVVFVDGTMVGVFFVFALAVSVKENPINM